jgi:hypothetical protein
VREKKEKSPDPVRSAKAKASWTPERRAEFSAMQRARANARSKSEDREEATVLGVLTVLRHAVSAVFADIRAGEITAKTITRKDALVLLAYVDLRGTK